MSGSIIQAAGSIIQGVGSIFGNTISASSANKNTDAQIKAQAEENEKTRKYNRELAEYQNQVNLEQYNRERAHYLEDWNRENEYNSPAAQMARYKSAGLNPNLIYGQQNTAGSLSSPSIAGSMTSGAPATPQDMSSIGNKRSVVGETILSLSQQALMLEQLKAAKLANREKEEDIKTKESDNAFSSWLRGLEENETFKNSLAGKRALREYQNLEADVLLKETTKSEREIDIEFKKRSNQVLLDKMAAELKISQEQARYIVAMMAADLGIKQAERVIKQSEAAFSVDQDVLNKINDASGGNLGWFFTGLKIIRSVFR